MIAKAIQQALGITELDYHTMVMNYGYDWLAGYFGNDDKMISRVASSKMFWAWWKNQWNIRNDKFVYETNLMELSNFSRLERIMLKSLYLDAHSPFQLNIRPNVLVMAEIKAHMWNEINKETVIINKNSKK